ncbi:hypothetical protein ACFRMQ_09685 [Kitasatospora sp. NPDC056783]|uniref:hypothetical protein n=1 Tax=Kitasatospora sp. NPDC056783 TaxID=3345943 RepID=UPI0036BC740B
MSVSRLDDLVAMETVHPAYIRVARGGQDNPGKAYTRVAVEHGAALTEAVRPVIHPARELSPLRRVP